MHNPSRLYCARRRSLAPAAQKLANDLVRRPLERLEDRILLSAVDVLTMHNDNSRTGANLSETVLNTSNVNVNTFGRLYSRPVDDQVYAQPLYVTGVNVPGQGVHNLLYVATVNDSVYAFDADDASVTTPYWKDSFINPAAGIRPVFHTDVGQNCGSYADFSGNIGIVGTPVIDRSTSTMYLVARTVENGTFVQRLHALDLATGAEKMGGPVVIQATYPGTGDGSNGTTIAFNPQTENQRAGLALVNGQVVITWSSHCDTGPYHGWVIGYNAANIQQQTFRWNDTPSGSDGGIWQSGEAPTIDAQGNLYFTVGNGTTAPTSANYGEAFIKLSPSGQVLDYFIPQNYQQLNNTDADLGSSGVLLIPGTNLIIGGGKEGKFFLLNTNNMGHLNTTDQVVQEWQVTPSAFNDHIHGSPVYYKDANGNQYVYVWGMSDVLRQFQFNGSTFNTTAVHTSNVTLAPTPSQPGGLLSVSANGTTPGSAIIWTTSTLGPSANQAVQPGIFRAFDAADVSHELYNSQQNAARDDFGNLAKFNYATVDNGHVYVPTFSNQIVVYGLLQNLPAAPTNFSATAATAANRIDLSWTAAAGAVQYVLERKVGGGQFSPLAIVDSSVTSYSDTNVTPGATYTYRLRSQNANGDSSPVTASAQVGFVQQMLARWKFDENAGTTASDSSGNNNTGTLGGGTGWGPGEINSGATFNGSTSYVQVADSPSLDPQGTQLSITAWFNAIDWNGNRRILQKGAGDNQYRFLAEGGVFKFDLFGVGTVTAPLPSTGVWHHVAGTYDGTNLNLYVDGSMVATAAGNGNALAVTADPLFIGTKAVGGTLGNHFNGTIDDVRVYNYALNGSQVMELATTNAAPAAPTITSVAPTSASTITISWTQPAGTVDGYYLERKTGAAGAYAQIASIPAGTNSFIDTGLAASTTYFYRVRAYNQFDASGYSPEVSGTTQGVNLNQLVAEWKFDESAGTTAADSTANHNNGTLVGGPTFVPDTADGSSHSLSLSGTDQWVLVPDSSSLDPTNAITLAAWVKSADWSGTRGIISKGAREGSYYLIADAGVLKFNLSQQGTLTAALPSTGVWHHVVGTYDGMMMKLYVDGVLAASAAASGMLATSGDNLFIGGTAASELTHQAFAGQIDDARVYNFAITGQQAAALYGLAALWKLDENAGSSAADASPNGNTLALVNSPAWAAGKSGSALSFDGATQYAQAADNQVLNPTSAITLLAWVNASDWNVAPRIIEKGNSDNQYRLSAEGGALTFSLGGVGSVTAPLPPIGAWHLVAGTYDGATMKLYVDGSPFGSTPATGAIATSTDPLYLATKAGGAAGTFFHGLLDNVAVYSRALTANEIQAIAGPVASVAGGMLFFNNSALDGNDPAINGGDDQAIADNKQPLLPGQTATFANYTNYSRGINGLMIDIANAPGTLTDGDFVFRVGAGGDSSTWAAAPMPQAFAMRSVAGTGGSARVEFTWPDGAIHNQWLQVTVKADANTGLLRDSVFYFGNLVGELTGDGSVGFPDLLALAQQYGRTTAPGATADLTADGTVDFSDLLALAQNYQATLPLITAPPAATTPAAAPTTTIASGEDFLGRKRRTSKARG